MTRREEIAARLGIFAGKAMFNCGIGAGGFQTGNTCGGGDGSGSTSKSTSKPTAKAPPITAKGLEERAQAAGRSFTDQYLHETRSAIDRDQKADERRRERRSQRAAAEVARIDTALEKVRKEREQAEAALAEARARVAELKRKAAESAERSRNLRS